MSIECLSTPQCFFIKVGKIFGWRNSAQIIMATEEGRQKGHTSIVFDFSECRHLDSAGLGTLMDTYRRLRPINGTVSVLNPNPVIQNILEVAKIETMITIYFSPDSEYNPARTASGAQTTVDHP